VLQACGDDQAPDVGRCIRFVGLRFWLTGNRDSFANGTTFSQNSTASQDDQFQNAMRTTQGLEGILGIIETRSAASYSSNKNAKDHRLINPNFGPRGEVFGSPTAGHPMIKHLNITRGSPSIRAESQRGHHLKRFTPFYVSPPMTIKPYGVRPARRPQTDPSMLH
jgi:hypothetical protein